MSKKELYLAMFVAMNFNESRTIRRMDIFDTEAGAVAFLRSMTAQLPEPHEAWRIEAMHRREVIDPADLLDAKSTFKVEAEVEYTYIVRSTFEVEAEDSDDAWQQVYEGIESRDPDYCDVRPDMMYDIACPDDEDISLNVIEIDDDC